MPSAANIPLTFIGCDVDKETIVVQDSRGKPIRSYPNTLEDLTIFAESLDATCFVVCEATGGYEAVLLAAMLLAGVPVHRADARRVKAFIRSWGTLGKTDAIDARHLARYGRERHAELARWQAPDADRDKLHALVLARQDLVASSVAYGNRLGAPGSAAARPFFEPVLVSIKAQIAAIDAATVTLISGHPTLQAAVKTLTAIAGIGAITAISLLALMPELGQLDRRGIAALAGLAPHPNQSAKTDGYRRTRGGRPDVRPVLFMAAMSAARHHETLSVFYKRLIANGKKKMVALIAVMRKLVVMCNAKLRPVPQSVLAA